MTIHVLEQWGPFAPGLDAIERTGRLRTLRAVTHLVCGPRGQATADLLRLAERDPDALPRALAALNAMAANDRRHVWASYAALTKPV